MSSNMSTEHMNKLTRYLEQYTPQNRLGFMRVALNKYRFENHKLSSNDIPFEDMIVQNNMLRSEMESILNQGSCSEDEFTSVFSKLTLDQIYYIGF